MPMRNVYSYAIVFLTVLALTGCGSDPEPSAEQKVKKILLSGGGQWEPTSTASSITLEGIDVADDLFPDFTLRFTSNKIFTTGTTPVWLREDTWSFKPGSKGKIIIRGMDGKEISIEEISSSQLKLTLEWDQTTYGNRASSSLPGLYEFILDK